MTARRLTIAIAAVLVAAGLAWVGVAAFAHGFVAECDNEAGTCLRQRQALAILLIGALCAAAAAGLGWMAWKTIARTTPRWIGAALVVGLCVLVVIALVDPVGHLDNRWTGWLAD